MIQLNTIQDPWPDWLREWNDKYAIKVSEECIKRKRAREKAAQEKAIDDFLKKKYRYLKEHVDSNFSILGSLKKLDNHHVDWGECFYE